MTAGRMKSHSTKSSGSRSEASRLSAANRRNEKTFFRGGTNAIIRRVLEKEPADSRTTKLYDRRGQKVLVEDMKRIRLLTSKLCI